MKVDLIIYVKMLRGLKIEDDIVKERRDWGGEGLGRVYLRG